MINILKFPIVFENVSEISECFPSIGEIIIFFRFNMQCRLSISIMIDTTISMSKLLEIAVQTGIQIYKYIQIPVYRTICS
jgi:hypothetical protein